MARYFDREPMTTSKPATARRQANALPAGPVPPRIPMRTDGEVTGHPVTSCELERVGGSMGLLDDKRILVTGVLTDDSLAFAVARLAQEQGAEIVLSGAGRGMGLTARVARKLPVEPEVVELDVTQPDHVAAVRDRLAEKWGRVDGALHAIGFAPQSCLGGGFLDAPWDDVSVAFHVSTYSLKVLADVVVPLMSEGGSIVGLDFDNSTMAFPA